MEIAFFIRITEYNIIYYYYIVPYPLRNQCSKNSRISSNGCTVAMLQLNELYLTALEINMPNLNQKEILTCLNW